MLKNHVRRTINFKKEKIKSLTDELQGSYEKVKSCYIFFLKIEDKFVNDKIKYKARDHYCYTSGQRGAAHSIYNSKYSIPKEITVAFHKGSNDDYNCIKRVSS